MNKIKVPEGMLKAALKVLDEFDGPHDKGIAYALEDALRWLSENPIVPTHSQVQEMANACPYYTCDVVKFISAWQERMFLDLGEELPKEVRALLYPNARDILMDNGNMVVSDSVNERIVEAYNRGKKAGANG